LHALSGRCPPTHTERMRNLSCGSSRLGAPCEARTVTRRFRFPDYRTALAFANAVSVLAEENWASSGASFGLGLLRGVPDDQKDRRSSRVRFRNGGPHRCARLRSARLRLTASTTPTEKYEPESFFTAPIAPTELARITSQGNSERWLECQLAGRSASSGKFASFALRW
jgi:hypothetical protein